MRKRRMRILLSDGSTQMSCPLVRRLQASAVSGQAWPDSMIAKALDG
ncbi:hypothetical protein PI125_g5185 [Phytophthora idaei]|nr:hypothetical protein PI125_g5185 [Phytophthora idaei]KAG3150647.1 hypothetical protein PI126_g11378 [Phytophthora idaei]